MNIENHWRNRLDALFADKEHATSKQMTEALNIYSHNNRWVPTISRRLQEIGYPVLYAGRNTWVKAA